jgi:hypothetical protein
MFRRRSLLSLLVVSCVCGPLTAAEVVAPKNLVPSATIVSAAYKMAEGLFGNLKEGKTEEIAKWLVDQVGSAWDAQTKVKNIGDYHTKLDMILVSPPAGSYGKLDSYDLIEESSLPGTDRYFRLTFMTYHENSPLLWQFRFYVKPDGKLQLVSCGWSDDNPFEYLAKSDMQLQRWYSH